MSKPLIVVLGHEPEPAHDEISHVFIIALKNACLKRMEQPVTLNEALVLCAGIHDVLDGACEHTVSAEEYNKLEAYIGEKIDWLKKSLLPGPTQH